MSAGHTLNSIAQGKGIFTPESTSFDESKSVILEGFADAKNERSSAISEREVQGSLTRATCEGPFSSQASQEIKEPALNVSNLAQCNITARPGFPFYGPETSCKTMTLTDQDGLLDTTTNKMYFPLIKREYMPEGRRLKDRAFYERRPTKDLLTYDPILFPSWCGKSASFSIWWDPRQSQVSNVFGGYIISKYEHDNSRSTGQKWSVLIGDGAVQILGQDPFWWKFTTPITFDWSIRRHVAIVFSHLTDNLCAYIDGTELGCVQMPDGIVASWDCNPAAYISFNHRIPGAWQPTTVIQVHSKQLQIVRSACTLRNSKIRNNLWGIIFLRNIFFSSSHSFCLTNERVVFDVFIKKRE